MTSPGGDLDVAIVGMAGRFPGAPTLEAFWENLAGGVESITRLSDDEILESGVPPSYLADPRYVRAAAILDEPGAFDAAFFGFPPAEARAMDPQHRLMLELAHEALESAGYDPRRFGGRIGVFAGSALNTYLLNFGLHRSLAEEYIPTLIGNDKDFLATRVSYKLDLKGPSVTVQSACSTSMVALHLACQSLLSGESDLALAGAVSVRVPHRAGYFCDGGGIVSADGHVRAFDRKANGTVFGSGGGVLAVMRLADALAEGAPVRAVIKGSAVNNDGSAKAGYTAPSVDRQADVVVEALANAGVDADSIGYVEAHGSGTPVGDPIEIRALTKAFRTHTRRSGYCAIGSVKTNVGHLDAAAAVAGIIKTVLAMERRLIPPSLHFSEPNPEIDFASTPFHVNAALADWTGDGPRRAGVLSTGMGGTNAHVVLEEAPCRPSTPEPDSPRVVLISARTETALDDATDRLCAHLGRDDAACMRDVAYTSQVGRTAFAHRRCFVCRDREDALAVLRDDRSKRLVTGRASETRRPVVLLLPGVGDQYVGMGYDLYREWPAFRDEVDRCARLLEPHLGLDVRAILYPEGLSRRTGNSEPEGIDLKRMLGRDEAPEGPDSGALDRTLIAQSALFTIEYAMARAWQALGLTPDAIVGHSLGEYVAACLAGVVSLDDALALVAERARLVESLPTAAMLAVAQSEADLRASLPDGVSISLVNGPELCVVAGPEDAVARFEGALAAREVITRRVRNGHAFHSSMLAPIVPALEAAARRVELREPAIPYVSNVTGTWITAAEATDPTYWGRHATATARFDDALRALWRLEDPILLEAGPGRTLGVLALQHPARPDHTASEPISSMRPAYERRSDVAHLLHAAGKLWTSGASLAWDALPASAGARRVTLPTYPFERRPHWLEPGSPAEADRGKRDSVERALDTSRWLYVPSWKRVLRRGVGRGDDDLRCAESRRWLFFSDDTPYTNALVARLRGVDHEVVTVRPGTGLRRDGEHAFTLGPSSPRDYEALMRALPAPPERIIHAWSLCGNPDGADDYERFDAAQARGFHSLLHLTRALAAIDSHHDVRLFVLSANVHEVTGTEPLRPERATILGPCMSIGQEYPDIRVTSIDVDMADRPGGSGSAVDEMIAELLHDGPDLFVAHRNGQRWIRSYEIASATRAAATRGVLREEGVYLVTGGLGEIGEALSAYLAAEYRARLVLVGRASLPPTDAWSAWVDGHPPDDPVRRRIEAVRRVERLGGRALYVQANVADELALRGAFEQAEARFGAVHGVIHAAGLVGDYVEIADAHADRCAAHFEAKAHGVQALASVLDGRPLDFCLLMSSLSAVLGGIGQAAYAASNIYLDAFARARNRTTTLPWLSVDWDVWRLGGDAPAPGGLGGTLEHLGMSADEATTMLETVLRLADAGHLVVSTGDLDARIDQWIRLTSLRAGASPTSPARARTHARRVTVDAPTDETEAHIARIWQDALGVESVGIHDGFAELGGHSLLAVRIVAQLRRAFQVHLPVRALFDFPTVADLSRHVQEHVIAEIEALTDEEAERLVAGS